MNNTIEEWKDIPNYEGLYQVSNFGNVKSLPKEIIRKNHAKFTTKEKFLKGRNHKGYYSIALYKEKIRKDYSIHVLVAMAFLDFKPCGMEKIIEHIDGDKSNNTLSNLEITSQRINMERYWSKQKSTSQYIGVDWDKQRCKWRAHIGVKNKNKQLGRFNTEIEAYEARQKALKMLENNDLSFMKPHKKSSQYKGVSWYKSLNKWVSEIRIDGKKIHLGCFTDEYEAHLAYEKAKSEIKIVKI